MSDDLLVPCSGDTVFLNVSLFQNLHESFSRGIFVNCALEVAEVWSDRGHHLQTGSDNGELSIPVEIQSEFHTIVLSDQSGKLEACV